LAGTRWNGRWLPTVLYMRDTQESEGRRAGLSKMNLNRCDGQSPFAPGSTVYGDKRKLAPARPDGEKLAAREALEAGLVTAATGRSRLEDEFAGHRIPRRAIADALTGLEANLRFGTPETLERAFLAAFCLAELGFLVAPNAVGRMVH